MDNPLHILVVEDSPIAQVVVKAQLIKLGCTVDIAPDGISALEKAISTRYDIILMDIGLGSGPDGFEVTIQIKEQSKLNNTTPIMAVTTHEGPEFNDRATEVGMEGYFNKPFNSQDAQKIIDYVSK